MVAGTCNRCWPGGCWELEARRSWSGCLAACFAPHATAAALAGLTSLAGRTRLVEKLEGVRREYLVGSGRKGAVQRISRGLSGRGTANSHQTRRGSRRTRAGAGMAAFACERTAQFEATAADRRSPCGVHRSAARWRRAPPNSVASVKNKSVPFTVPLRSRPLYGPRRSAPSLC